VENAELEVALEELESRLERLRALYEQYFMGIERIEPAIPRKDIDRRIYVLRREKIRNTAKRFKLQTIISRYNTFQQYWQRICREIENGTYKRHVIRAERIAPGQILTIAARKRLGRAALEAMNETDAAPSDSVAPPSARPSSPPSAPPSGPRLPSLRPPAPAPQRLAPPPKPVPPPKPGARPAPPATAQAAAPPATAQAAAPPATQAPGGAPPVPPLRAPTANPAAATTSPVRPPPPPRAPAPVAAVTAAAAPTPPPPARTPAPARPAFESLDLDMDFLGDWDPNKSSGKRPGPARPFGKPLSQPMNTPPTPGAVNKAQRSAPTHAAPAAPATPRAPSAPPLKPVTIAPRPAAATKPLSAHPAPPPAAARPLAPIIPGTTRPKPAAAKPAPTAAAPPAVDDRVRELHARLIEAKRQTQDNAAVSMEGLAKSMKATEAKLREQHKNRKIDFDVVIKDGKAVLKPIVR